MADYQTAGRGQQNTKWYSEPGKNITASVLLYPGFLHPQNQFDLNRAVSLALCETLELFLQVKTHIKWPNDLFVKGRKLCGMLIENSIMGVQIRSSVIGFGINVNQENFASEAGSPVSMIQTGGKEYDLMVVLSAVCQSLEARYLQLRNNNTLHLRKEYDERLYRRNETHHYMAGGGRFEGAIRGTSKEGLLKMDTENGPRCFNFKEISYVL